MDYDTVHEPLALGEDLVEEDLMECDDDSDTECNYNAGENEAEVKVEVIMISDSCLLCGQSPAVSYDCEGKPIKREPPQLDYSYQHLFSSLCHLLAIRKSCRIWTKWDFDKEPFPFCEKCESLMTSLAELRGKLDKLESNIKDTMKRSEGKYVEDNLYERHHNRYYEFRKAALGEHFLGTEVKVLRRTNRCRQGSNRNSSSLKTEDDFIKSNPMAIQSIQTPMKQPLQHAAPQKIQIVKGKPKSNKSHLKIRQKKKKSKTKKVAPSEDAPTPTTEGHKEMSVENEVTIRGGLPTVAMESICSKFSSKSDVAKCKGISDRKRKYTKRGSAEDVERNREEKKAERKQKERQAFEDKYSTLLRLSKIPRSEMTPKEVALFALYPIVRDPDTSEITLFTGSGNRYMNKRVVLKFTKLEGNLEEKIFKYQCTSCSEIVTLNCSALTNQILGFRAHFRRSHMKVYRCKLCPEDCDSTCFKNKSDLLAHLGSEHKVDSIFQMNLKKWAPPKVGCHICGMPFDKRSTIQFNLHLKSHMSEEEKQNFSVTKRKGRVHLPTPLPKDESLCETCGISVGGGSFNMTRHKKTHHKDKNIIPKPCLCSLCGDTLSDKYALAGHVKRMHPDGKPTGPSCKFPTCEGRSFDTELSLKEHVAEDHLDSEENRKGLLCLLCGRVFTGTQGKSFHNSVHTKEKKFKCNYCSKRFTLKGTVLLHEAAVHRQGGSAGEFRCEVEGCLETFPCKIYLGSHLRSFHGIYKRKQKAAEENKSEGEMT